MKASNTSSALAEFRIRPAIAATQILNAIGADIHPRRPPGIPLRPVNDGKYLNTVYDDVVNRQLQSFAARRAN